ncbi:MAG: FeoA family protein [Candidatus Sumerlaeota bacterium]|nr:FeoA family protein [Candidatus Sumerlaeota bacterium]
MNACLICSRPVVDRADTPAESPPRRARAESRLSDSSAGRRFRVVRLAGRAEVDRRLEAIGLRPGLLACVFQAFGRGPMIIATRDMRLALDRSLAEEIWVAEP